MPTRAERQHKPQIHPLNPGEAKVIKTTIERLNAIGARQALLGIVNVLTTKPHLPVTLFTEIIDDAWRLTAVTEQKGMTSVEYAIMVALIAGVIVTAVTLLGGAVKGLFEAAAGLFQYLQ